MGGSWMPSHHTYVSPVQVTLHATLQNGIFSAHPPSTRANVRGRHQHGRPHMHMAAPRTPPSPRIPLPPSNMCRCPPPPWGHLSGPCPGLSRMTAHLPLPCQVGAFMAALATEASTWQRWKNSSRSSCTAPSLGALSTPSRLGAPQLATARHSCHLRLRGLCGGRSTLWGQHGSFRAD